MEKGKKKITPEEQPKNSKQVSRREFLKDAGLIAGGAAIGSVAILSACTTEKTLTETATATSTATTTTTVTAPAVTTTVTSPPITKLINYTLAKQMVQANPYYCASCSTCAAICSARIWGESNPTLSGIKITQDRMNGDVTINTCHQCAAPSCMQACLTGAISVNATTGARVIDQVKCTGCRLCEYACPFGAVVYNPKTKKCFKCDLCGGTPLCIANCPSGTAALKLVDPTQGGA